MKKEELFEGAIVLARKSIYERRSRCKIMEIGDRVVKIERQKDNCIFSTGITYLRPAKITPKALRECGFEDPVFRNCKGKCFLYTGTKVHLLLKDSACGNKTENILKVPWKHGKVRYMHEVQREVLKLRIKDYRP